VQPHTFAFHRNPNCLFKWQVIPSKQITPVGALACVVFLQQTVARKELMHFHWIDLGSGWVKQRIRRMGIVGNIQDDLL
jgi:hypothetical protein